MAVPTKNVDDVDFFIKAIMTADGFAPNWAALAALLPSNISANNTQRKFRALVEKSGKYECKKSVITFKPGVDQDADADTIPATPAMDSPSVPAPPKPKRGRPKKHAATEAGTNPSKRVKVEEDPAEEE